MWTKKIEREEIPMNSWAAGEEENQDSLGVDGIKVRRWKDDR
jgi:hypothetical protein